MDKIAPLPRAVRDYIAAFELAAVARYRDGRVGVTRDPSRAVAAWWCQADQAGRLIKATQAGEDIAIVARRLDMVVTEHAIVAERAAAAVKKIDAGMAWAQRTGVLMQFNAEYKRRRLAAASQGKGFMSYSEATARLRQAIVRSAISGCGLTKAIAGVFSQAGAAQRHGAAQWHVKSADPLD
jgi:hypothetical protein